MRQHNHHFPLVSPGHYQLRSVVSIETAIRHQPASSKGACDRIINHRSPGKKHLPYYLALGFLAKHLTFWGYSILNPWAALSMDTTRRISSQRILTPCPPIKKKGPQLLSHRPVHVYRQNHLSAFIFLLCSLRANVPPRSLPCSRRQ